MRQRDIRGFRATYHRNGICGESFHLCEFKFYDGSEFVQMRAIVFDRPGYVAVTSDNPLSRWRGDEFEPVLREAISLQDQAQPEAAHAR